MLNKNKKLTVITFILLITLVLIIEVAMNSNNFSRDEKFNYNSSPISQAISIENYTPIIEDKRQGLGTVNITNVIYDKMGLFNYTSKYPNLDEDIDSGALLMSYNDTKYIDTIKIAQSDNLNDSVIPSNIITVVLNETININYDNPSAGFLIYKPSLALSKLKQFLVQNESSSQVVELNEDEYSIDEFDFVVFNYSKYFEATTHNFAMHLIWEVNITLTHWNIFPDTSNEIIVTKQEQELKPRFNYNFTVSVYMYNPYFIMEILNVSSIEVDLKVIPPDRDKLSNHTLEVNGDVVSNFLDGNNTMNFTIGVSPSIIRMNFTTNYTIRFENPLDYSWTIDRLIENNNVRERIYIPTLVSGPDHIYLSQIVLYESSITIDQVLSNYSLFDRDVLNFDANLSVVEEYSETSLIFTENAIRKKGLKIIIPYLIKGETNPFFITYNANNDLLIIITDIIHMPIMNLNLELYFYNKPFGTYISNDFIQPSASISTDFNGEVSIKNLPTGNYTLRIFRKSNLIKETVINTFSKTHYIITDVLHFPLVIMIFGLISGIIFLIGLILYLNSKRIR